MASPVNSAGSTMQGSPNGGGAGGPPGSGGNPRKFSEKIQNMITKGTEGTAEFEKIMSECATVKAQHQVTDTMPVMNVNVTKVNC